MHITKNQIIRHHKLDRCFSNYGREYTIDDLLDAVNEALAEYDPNGTGVQLRTLRNDIKFMRSPDGYNAPIETFRGANGQYYRYIDRTFSINKSPLNTTEAEQLKSAVSILQRFEGSPEFSWVSEIAPLLSDKFALKGSSKKIMSFESNIDYAGYSFITPLFNAIVNKCPVRITYEPYNGHQYGIDFHPYYLKQYNNRWFVFGLNEFKDVETWNLALDRILEIEQRPGVSYIDDATDWEEYFEDIIGVSKDPSKIPVEVKINFNAEQAPYILTKPLHLSQKNRILDNGELEVRITVIPNFELETLILSFGDRASVISPDDLKEKISERVKLLSKNY
ncbi:MAG: WYL domain-containing protein [Flavobacterium sp.]|nr:MAG: WYL domain-containing protein [Flavobacterium sp.]